MLCLKVKYARTIHLRYDTRSFACPQMSGGKAGASKRLTIGETDFLIKFFKGIRINMHLKYC